MACALDCDCQLALMACTRAGNTARHNFGALGKESSELRYILVINRLYFIHAEGADFFSALALVSIESLHSHDLLFKN